MKLAILGATGQIGRSLALALARRHDLTLFARRPEAAQSFARAHGLAAAIAPYDELAHRRFDLVVNAVGDGAPGRIRGAGAAILDVTAQFDRLCLDYLEHHRAAMYVHMSTGAIYGKDYREALRPSPELRVPVNAADPGLFYPLAKRIAELRHRERPSFAIADIRIFGFVSPEIDLGSDFLVAQMLKALVRRLSFRTGPDDIVRDYVGADDLAGFIELLVSRGCPNGAYDLLSAAPTSKFRLLEALASRCGLEFEVEGVGQVCSAASLPPRLSNDRAAEALGFRPLRSSLDNVLSTAATIIPARSAIASGLRR